MRDVFSGRWLAVGLALAVTLGASTASAGDDGGHAGPLKRLLVASKPYGGPADLRFAHVPPNQPRLVAQPVPAYPNLQGASVPNYNWGYFGARYHPNVVRGGGYYNNWVQWSFRPGE